jgi:isopropylmalate/homocitrate/citramalate synthase
LSEREHIAIVEVGPRDGLQNEKEIVPLAAKIAFVNALGRAGARVIETTSFVHPKLVPQLADAADVMRGIERQPGVRYPVLIPNERGLERALEAGVDSIALFTSATEAVCQAIIRCSIDESFERFEPVIEIAKERGVWIRGYVSVAFTCPYSGPVDPTAPVEIAQRLFEAGCDEVSIADTIGSATAPETVRLLAAARGSLPFDKLALHFHDTYGHAVDNIAAACDAGIRIFDSSAGGLGGCPFAPGAAGNVATEAVVEFFESQGVATGIDPDGIRGAVANLRAV